jgi:putative ABC transport system permease protein
MLALLRTFSWQELRHHPWRNAAAVVAVMLGVALAFSVHLINASALGEFSSAVRAVNGQPDLELRSMQGTLDESLFGRVATHPQVALASPVLELSTYATGPDRKRLPVRVVGVDALTVAAMAPALMPLPAPGADRLALLAPSTVFLNPAAMAALVPGGLAGASGPSLQLQSALALRAVIVAGTVNAPGAPLAVMDIGAAQDLFGAAGRLSRIDLRLQPGTDRAAFIAALQLPAGVTAGEPGDAAERVSNLSRAYRVNLTVLALVALFTGAFLVFSVLSLSVARRAQQFALLGVLGLTPLQRLRLVLVESLLLGAAGSTAGIALGTALAALALRLLGGDLGGGFFAGVAPPLQWEGAAALLYGLLGVAAAGVGGWWPARAAQHLPPAQTLKGLGAALQSGQHRAVPLLLIAAGVLLAQTPPVAGIPLAAYVSVGLLLVGGITALPWLIGLTYDRLAPWVSRRLLPLLAVERARRVRESAAVAVSGVVASLSLAVALTVMVASFRDSVTHWLDVVLPADLYVRAAMGTGAADTVYFPPELVGQIAQLPGVKRLATQRFVPLQLDPARPAVALISRDGDGMGRGTALVGEALPVPVGQIGIWVSEAMVDLYGARPGQVFAPLSAFFRPVPIAERSSSATFFVAGVWRDYARQSGAIVIDRHDYERLTGDRRVNDLALWLADGADAAQVQADVRRAARSGRQALRRPPGSTQGWSSPRPRRSAPPRCASSTAASLSPTGCRPWPLPSACSAWRRASARRCWPGARSSACWHTWV